MPAYYIYTLDDDGHIERRIDAICADDEQANAVPSNSWTGMSWSYGWVLARSRSSSQKITAHSGTDIKHEDADRIP